MLFRVENIISTSFARRFGKTAQTAKNSAQMVTKAMAERFTSSFSPSLQVSKRPFSGE